MEGDERARMVDLRSDSAMCRRIGLAILDFLKSVEPAPGVDLEGLDVARDCLEEVFKLSQSSVDERPKPGFLINLFSAEKANGLSSTAVDMDSAQVQKALCISTLSQDINNHNVLPLSHGNKAANQQVSGDSRDELFVKFYAALDKINFFSTSVGETEDPLMVAKATELFYAALDDIENSQDIMNLVNLAEHFKLKGNQSLKLKNYSEAVDLYTFAIALCEKNAVYYCNRAAAYTQMEKYTEAITDCLKSIEIDPDYSKAFSRLGLAYYNQGNYFEALEKGFLKALQLDPNNDYIKENIRASQQKLESSSGADRKFCHGQDSTGNQRGSTTIGNSFGPPPFTIDGSNMSPEIINLVRNMVFSSTQGRHGQDSLDGLNQSQSTRTHQAQESATQGASVIPEAPFPPFPFSNNITVASDLPNVFNRPTAAAQGPQAHAGMPGNNMQDNNEPNINASLNLGQTPEQIMDAFRNLAQTFSTQNESERPS